MKFVTSNVNVILMSTIVLIAIFGVAYYNYQEVKFQQVHTENAQLKAQVAQLETNLTAQEERLRSIFGELQNQLEDSVKFENLYGEVTSERDELETDLQQLQADYQRERQDRIAAENEAQQYSSEIADLEELNIALRASLQQCSEDLDTCEEENQCP